MHGIVREEFAVLLRKLCRERLVVRDYKRGFADIGYNIRHRESLAGAGGCADQDVISLVPCLKGFNLEIIDSESERRHEGVAFDEVHFPASLPMPMEPK